MKRTAIRLSLALAGALALLSGPAGAADLSEITVDWATYNPVSILLKNEVLLEKEFAKDGITVRWVQSAGSNKALKRQAIVEAGLALQKAGLVAADVKVADVADTLIDDSFAPPSQ